ncbi:DUF5667 domain-containing protein [Streptomyces sp. NPDC052236]|uniref:DUF5667 domain-containing protein n=1 Tax=Streptomyces sp. NPDC052236 TaxID=3365686 RepID=UPI0037CD9A21
MIANISPHRRANAFAKALEDQAAEQPEESVAPNDQTAHGRLLALANGLGELPGPKMDPEVKVVQRAQLVAAMEALMAQTAATEGDASEGPTVPEQRTAGRGAHRASALRRLRPRSRWSKGIAAGGLTVSVAAGAFSGVAAASAGALPGDSLYGLKRGMEDLKLGMADDDSDRGGLYLDQASTRLSEARRLLERQRLGGALDHESVGEVRRALKGMRHDVTEGHRLLHQAYERDGSLGPMARLDSFSRAHRSTWNGLRDRLPAQLTDVREEVNSVFDAIDQEVGPLESMLPRPPDRDQGPGSPGPTDGTTGSSAPGGGATPTAPSSADGRASGSGRPHPSGSDSTADDSLIGGNTGGLFEPPAGGTTPPAPPGKKTAPAQPDVTIPPLLPGLLPRLGMDGKEVP